MKWSPVTLFWIFKYHQKPILLFQEVEKPLFYKYGTHRAMLSAFSHGLNAGLAVDFYHIAKVRTER